jgi:hypothetical protein
MQCSRNSRRTAGSHAYTPITLTSTTTNNNTLLVVYFKVIGVQRRARRGAIDIGRETPASDVLDAQLIEHAHRNCRNVHRMRRWAVELAGVRVAHFVGGVRSMIGRVDVFAVPTRRKTDLW